MTNLEIFGVLTGVATLIGLAYSFMVTNKKKNSDNFKGAKFKNNGDIKINIGDKNNKGDKK